MENKKNDDVIRLGDIFRVLWKNIILVAIITAIVFVCGIVYTFAIAKPEYSSSQSFVVAVRDAGTGEIENGTTPSAFIVNTVAGLTKQTEVLQPVAEKHNMTVGSLRNMISVSYSSSGTSLSGIIGITVECNDAALAQTLAGEVFDSLQSFLQTTSIQDYYGCTVVETSPASAAVQTAPNKVLFLAIFAVGGIVLGCISVYIKEFCSTKFRTKRDVEGVLGEKIIGFFVDDKSMEKRENDERRHIELVEPGIVNYEPYNKLYTNIKYANMDNPYRVIMVTSSQEKELKSSTVGNLACCLKYNKQNVVVVDMDMRRPMQHKLFGLSKENGIIEYVDGTCTKDEIIKSGKYGVDIITVGKHVINPIAIIQSEKFTELLKLLSKEYDYVIIDTPPALACADAAAISKLCDGVVFNVSMRDVKKKHAVAALSSLEDVGANIIGINVTKALADKHDDSYYYNKYYISSHEGAESGGAAEQ